MGQEPGIPKWHKKFKIAAKSRDIRKFLVKTLKNGKLGKSRESEAAIRLEGVRETIRGLSWSEPSGKSGEFSEWLKADPAQSQTEADIDC